MNIVSATLGHAPHEAVTTEDRIEAAVLAAAQRALRLAVQCTRCRQWLVAETSVRAHLCPTCRAKLSESA
jgi:hypothetical protein